MRALQLDSRTGSVRGSFAKLVAVLSVSCPSWGCDSSTAPAGGNGTDVVAEVEIVIDVEADRVPISPFIYGSNQDRDGDVWAVRRYGGNRLTGYNWENNFSNAGSDYQHSSDTFLLDDAGVPAAERSEPARAMTFFHDRSLKMAAESIVTLQTAGYVSADGHGPVPESATAPSPRWVKVEPKKGAGFAADPDLKDGVVYMDELVDRLVRTYGTAASPIGVRWYALDNEPALWPHTHPRIHPKTTGARELVDRSVALASAVKDVDPSSEVLGPVLYGMAAYTTLQEAADWGEVRGPHDSFIDYYLDRMRQAEQVDGRRLVDFLDVHWYPEARGDHRITDDDATTGRDVEARLQAPRTLWDSTYIEDSWIAEFLSDYLPILPRLRQSIEAHYPGTGLAITEYNYGGGASISGGLAQADVLGIFGRYGVDIATLWGIGSADVYTSAAFKLYRDYDGEHGAFGDTSVGATTSDPAAVSVHAAIVGDGASHLHVILLNKTRQGASEVNVTIASPVSYTAAEVWGFDASTPEITRRTSVIGIAGNTFDYVLQPLTGLHLILQP